MKRRRTLALLGTAFTGITGCVSEVPSRTNDGSPESSPEEDTETDTKGGPTVEDIIVRKAVRYQSIMGSGGVLAWDDQQYVVAAVRDWQGEDLAVSRFSFEADGRSWSPGLPETAGAINHTVEGYDGGPVGRSVGGQTDTSYLAFTIPSPLSASDPRIRISGGAAQEWPLATGMRDHLAAPAPRFELESLTVPTTVSQGDSLSITMNVANTSTTDGRFLAAVYWPTKLIADDDESHIIERNVAAGENASASVVLDTRYTSGDDELVTMSVEGHVSDTRQVHLRNATTPE